MFLLAFTHADGSPQAVNLNGFGAAMVGPFTSIGAAHDWARANADALDDHGVARVSVEPIAAPATLSRRYKIHFED